MSSFKYVELSWAARQNFGGRVKLSMWPMGMRSLLLANFSVVAGNVDYRQSNYSVTNEFCKRLQVLVQDVAITCKKLPKIFNFLPRECTCVS